MRRNRPAIPPRRAVESHEGCYAGQDRHFGSVIAALCCFTPILVIGLGVVGLSAWLGWLDYVLLRRWLCSSD